jgi:hypothetical protein
MKRTLLTFIIVISGILLISWGIAGHKTVAAVAEKHLLPNVSSVVSTYLAGQEMAGVGSWADEMRDQQEYKHTAPWHFLNLPLGLSHDAFVQYVEGLANENIYTAILKSEATLKDNSANVAARQDALKFLIHFVGDAHLVSRKQLLHIIVNRSANLNAGKIN